MNGVAKRRDGAFFFIRIACIWHYQSALVLTLIGLAFLSGCVDTTTVRPDEVSAAGQVVVVGRLRVLHEGEDNEWSLFRPARIYIARDGKGKAASRELMRSDGMFFLPLEPGEYMFVGASFNNPKSWSEGQLARTSRVGARFTVPQGVESVYIGTVKIEALEGGYIQSIDDDYEMGIAAYLEKYSGRDNPSLALMEVDRRIGSYNRMQAACSAVWGVKCEGKYGGLTPTYPPVETNNFPVVSDVQPTFTWEPSTTQGVLYDFVLYRAVSYSPLGIGGKYLPGKVVEYSQGLTDPTYQPSKPLEPDQKYFWSIRLRRDGIVSNWSRFSYFNFMIFAYTSGHSSWFGFATPEKAK